MPVNLLASFNSLLIGSGADKVGGRKSHSSRDGNELLEEWPCRDIMINKEAQKPPSSIDVKVSHPVPLRQESSGYTGYRPTSRTSSYRRQVQQANAKSYRRGKEDESSCATTADDSTLFCSVQSSDFSCYSLDDLPASGDSILSGSRRHSAFTVKSAPGLSRKKSRRDSSHYTSRRESSSRRGSWGGSVASCPSRAPVKKSVSFSEEAPSIHSYVRIAPNTHYSADDDDYLRESTMFVAEKVLRLLKTEAVYDETFDTLTGLPSAHCLRRYLNHPIEAEEVVGIEDLLAGTGVANARKRLKKVQVKKVLAEQRRQRLEGINDPRSLARLLRKTSSISSNIARCRAAYARAIEE